MNKYLQELEKQFDTIIFNDKEYILAEQAEITNRLLSYPKNFNDVSEGEEFDFEMSARAYDREGFSYMIYWIFSDIKGNEKELDSFDYDDVADVKQL